MYLVACPIDPHDNRPEVLGFAFVLGACPPHAEVIIVLRKIQIEDCEATLGLVPSVLQEVLLHLDQWVSTFCIKVDHYCLEPLLIVHSVVHLLSPQVSCHFEPSLRNELG